MKQTRTIESQIVDCNTIIITEEADINDAELLLKRTKDETKRNRIMKSIEMSKEIIIEQKQKKIELQKQLKPKSSKSNMIKEVQDAIDMVSNIKIPKKTNSKNLSKVIEITELIAKTPKLKKINSKKASKEIDELHAAIDKAMKSKKPKTKVMQMAKGYVHKSKDVSPFVQHYVNEFKSILSSGKTKGVITRALNKLRSNFYYTAKPSEVDDATSMIRDYRETLPKPVKVVKAKVPKTPSEDADYQKQLKAKIAYIKKNKPSITDPEDLKIIADEMIGKNRRSSKMCLDECLNDLGMSGSGIRRRRMKGRGGEGESKEGGVEYPDEEEEEADDSGEDEEESEEEPELTYEE
jgi:ElaB/YqjD/DUF883 family membrane-anchored ribosome-binding protein